MAKTSRTQNMVLVIAALGIIVLFAAGTLYMKGSLTMFASSPEQGASRYQTVTLTDALMECEKYARDELGDRLRALSVDTHSTRFDNMDQRFKVFFVAELYDDEDRKGVSKSFHVNCLTRGNRATVAQFKILEDKEHKTEAIQRQEGGVFGWPVN